MNLRLCLSLVGMAACAGPRPDDLARVSRERLVQSTGTPARDRWFVTVFTLQSLLGADERLRAETLSRLAAALHLAPDADPEAIAAAIHARADAEHATLSLPPYETPALATAVEIWAQSLASRDVELTEFERVLGLDQGLSVSVGCAPAAAPVCAAVAPELTRALRTTLVRRALLDAVATSPQMREAVAARADEVSAGAASALAGEFTAARDFLRGVHARATAMADADARREQWIRAIATPDVE